MFADPTLRYARPTDQQRNSKRVFIVIGLAHDAVMACRFPVIAGINDPGAVHQIELFGSLHDKADLFVDNGNQPAIAGNNPAYIILGKFLIKAVHPRQILNRGMLRLVGLAPADRHRDLVEGIFVPVFFRHLERWMGAGVGNEQNPRLVMRLAMVLQPFDRFVSDFTVIDLVVGFSDPGVFINFLVALSRRHAFRRCAQQGDHSPFAVDNMERQQFLLKSRYRRHRNGSAACRWKRPHAPDRAPFAATWEPGHHRPANCPNSRSHGGSGRWQARPARGSRAGLRNRHCQTVCRCWRSGPCSASG